jgi:hypothetical protein
MFWQAARREAWRRGSDAKTILREVLHVHFYGGDEVFRTEARRDWDAARHNTPASR